MSRPEISFYLPEEDLPPFAQLPGADEMADHPRRFLSPALNWTWRTYHHLASAGFPCRLVHRLPERGIIVGAACNLPLFFRPEPQQFIVCCVADSPPRFYTPCSVFQSASQAATERTRRLFPVVAHLPHWPQPGLLPRADSRGGEFRHVDYFGARDQLEPGLQSPAFAAQVRALGLQLRFHFDHYHDYRTSDAVLAVRSFGVATVTHKPASKLINAWHAGVPAVLGAENAFRELRRSPLDYLEVRSAEECLNALRRLRDDPALRSAIAAQGRQRSQDFAVPVLTREWARFLGETLPSCYERWTRLSRTQRHLFFAERTILRLGASLARRIRKVIPLAH